ncbi:glycoside hydrolase [Streptomyces sp. Ru73]|uniref:C40 family peptidase n=1 Tax=Streptomyces sp. Ru73 TaxID=2080748 RepID=UPI000CDD29C4|nr:C40 family peptidase [Streptomyces sp. Ru73]POX38159.1 glycoside hydrolase [Streptomyces sp. Ru73]
MTARDHHPALRLPAAVSRAAAVSALTLALMGGGGLVPGSTADASAATPASAVTAASSGSGQKALRVAASKKGAPYKWGATGPHRFDCSGLTQYAFKRAGKRLPRTADSQYRHVRHVKASSRKRGDLVFFHSGRYVYHVGIYAGKGRMWHAPKPGASVRKERIWTRSVWYGRA